MHFSLSAKRKRTPGQPVKSKGKTGFLEAEAEADIADIGEEVEEEEESTPTKRRKS